MIAKFISIGKIAIALQFCLMSSTYADGDVGTIKVDCPTSLQKIGDGFKIVQNDCRVRVATASGEQVVSLGATNRAEAPTVVPAAPKKPLDIQVPKKAPLLPAEPVAPESDSAPPPPYSAEGESNVAPTPPAASIPLPIKTPAIVPPKAKTISEVPPPPPAPSAAKAIPVGGKAIVNVKDAEFERIMKARREGKTVSEAFGKKSVATVPAAKVAAVPASKTVPASAAPIPTIATPPLPSSTGKEKTPPVPLSGAKDVIPDPNSDSDSDPESVTLFD